ncbi:MAG: 50S ribosomal protein L29 [Flavobacteriaceae bacterium]|nr:50S ribosomal protein L29 [Flavobacteriaceae bacterium]
MKALEIKDLSVEDLTEKLGALKDELKKLKLAHSINPIENPLQIKYLRKDVARVSTVLTSKINQDS